MKVPVGEEIPQSGSIQPWENEQIPSGYTYLAQLIGHDLVHSSMSIASISDAVPKNKNLRTTGLMLDTLYGGGPAEHVISYYRPGRINSKSKVPDYSGIPTYLRMSSVRDNNDNSFPNTFRDLPRIRALNSDFQGHRTKISTSSKSYSGLSEVLIADPRNDDNAIIAQLTALFHMFHNTVIKKIEDNESVPIKHSRAVQDLMNFQQARSIVIYTYHKIIREDFLKRILHPCIYKYYYADENQLLDEHSLDDIPIEFSNAAYRFGHAMIRPEYILAKKEDKKLIKSIINHSSSRISGHFPLRSNWILNWSNFFHIEDKKAPINLSRKISPYITTNLANVT